MEITERQEIGRRLREARRLVGLTQTQLATELGYTSDRVIRKWEAGDLGEFFARLDDLVVLLDQPRHYFVGEPDTPAIVTEQLSEILAEIRKLNALLAELVSGHGEAAPLPFVAGGRRRRSASR